MTVAGRSPQIEGALLELQRYFQNEIPPDAGAGSAEIWTACFPACSTDQVPTCCIKFFLVGRAHRECDGSVYCVSSGTSV